MIDAAAWGVWRPAKTMFDVSSEGGKNIFDDEAAPCSTSQSDTYVLTSKGCRNCPETCAAFVTYGYERG